MGKNGKERLFGMKPTVVAVRALAAAALAAWPLLVAAGGLTAVGQEASERAVREKALSALKARDYRTAVDLCAAYLKERPDDVEVSLVLARAYAYSGRYQEARAVLARVLEAEPGHRDALLLEARIFLWSRDYRSAEAELMSLIRKDGRDTEALLELGRVKEATGDVSEAEEIYLGAWRSDPGQPEACYYLGRFYLRQGRPEAARKYLEQAVSLQPDNRDYRAALNELRLRYGKVFEVRLEHRFDDYGGQEPAFPSESLYLYYKPSDRLTLIPRLTQARYFHRTDRRLGLEIYPRLWPGAYARVDLSYATPAAYLARSSLTLEVYQTVRRGLEASLGFWGMHFTDRNIGIWLASSGFYFGPYYAALRGYFTPGEEGRRISWYAQARKYFGRESYVYLAYGSGSRPLEITNSQDLLFVRARNYGAGFNVYLRSRLKLEAHVLRSLEKEGLRKTTVSLTAGWRF